MLRPNKERSNRLIIILWFYTALELLTAVSDVFQYFLLKRIETGNFEMRDVNANDTRQSIIAIGMILIYIGVAVVFIQWFRRAYYNLHQLSTNLSHSEGWAAGAWFVPIMNLGRPFMIMKEMMSVAENMLIHESLIRKDDNRKRSVGIWWTLWISISIFSDVNARIQNKSEDITILANTTLIDVALSLAYIPLTIFTVKMIKYYAELETYLPQITANGIREIKIDDSDILDSI